ncbi:MAG: AraC family transcriptional regulator [Pricia sp.]
MLLNFLIFTGVLFSFLTAFLISFRFTPTTFSTRLLASYIFLNALCTSFYLVIVYGLINYFPFLYKVPAPLTYLIPPICYIYVRAVLNDENGFKKSDVIHLLPFLFFTVNYLPFYFMDIGQKSMLVFEVTQNFESTYLIQNGLMPEWINIAARSLLAFVYLGLQWRLILTFFKKHRNSVSNQFALIKKWVFDLTWMQTFYLSALFVVYVANALLVFYNTPVDDFIRLSAGFLVGATLLFISGYLLWNPKLLIGLPHLSIRKSGVSDMEANSEEKIIFEMVDRQLKEGRLFLDSHLKITSLSEIVNISSRRISYSIGESPYENFNDYINHVRIEHATQLIQNGYLEQFSVDALSESSGFNSKNAFYRAFKKVHDCTPGKFTEQNTRVFKA